MLPHPHPILAAGTAMSWRPRCPGQLRVRTGRVWLTMSGKGHPHGPGDHVLTAGQTWLVPAGVHVAVEAWMPAPQSAGGQPVHAPPANVHLDWTPLPHTSPHTLHATPWQRDVAQPWRELRSALAATAWAGVRVVGGLLAYGTRWRSAA